MLCKYFAIKSPKYLHNKSKINYENETTISSFADNTKYVYSKL